LQTISREELQAKLDRSDDFKLVMTLDKQSFKEGHIPNSINISSMEQAEELIAPQDEIVVYCHDENCPSSVRAYQMLANQGFSNVRRYAGGIRDWAEAGLPVERDPQLKEDKSLPTTLSQPVTEEDHRQGQMNAEIQLLVYGDYQCPYTRRTMTHIKGLQRRLGDSILFVFRHFPAPVKLHPYAWIASEAALAANAQGKFWEMHDHLFRHQLALTYDDLLNYAAELGLDLTRFKSEMDDHIYDSRINRDRQSGWDSGVRGIPTLFINRVRYQGSMKLAAISQAIENISSNS